MTPTTRRGPPPESTDDTLYDRILQGQFGVLIPAGQAAVRLRMKDEALRRYGRDAETMLACALPTGDSGARMYPEQLLGMMDRAQTQKASGRALSRQAALGQLLSAAGWVDDTGGDDTTPSDSLDRAELQAALAELHTLTWRLSDLGPRLGGVLAENLAATEELNEVLNRVTLELPQVLPHLARIQNAHHTVQASAEVLVRQVTALSRTADGLAEHIAALHRERGAMRHQLRTVPWMVALSACLGSGVSHLLMLALHG